MGKAVARTGIGDEGKKHVLTSELRVVRPTAVNKQGKNKEHGYNGETVRMFCCV